MKDGMQSSSMRPLAFLPSSVSLCSPFLGASPSLTGATTTPSRQPPGRRKGIVHARFNVFSAHDRYADWAAELFGNWNTPHVQGKSKHTSMHHSLGEEDEGVEEDGEVEAVGEFEEFEEFEEVGDDEVFEEVEDDEEYGEVEDDEEFQEVEEVEEDEVEHQFGGVGANAGNPTYTVFNPEFRTALGHDVSEKDDYTVRKVLVTQRRYITGARDVVEIEVDIAGTALDGGHTKPGMFCQLGVGERRGLFTVASRPDKPGVIAFLIGLRDDSLGLGQVQVGETIRISPFLGEGLEYQALASKETKNLYILVDCVQGYAAARSLLEWEPFRSATGEGMNRTTRVTVAYSLSQVGSLPDTARFGDWAMFGINVIPVVGQSLVEYLQGGGICGSMGGGVRDHCAAGLACVASLHGAERIYSELAGKGVQRDRFCMYTEHLVENEVKSFKWDGVPIDLFRENYSSSSHVASEDGDTPTRPWGMPDDVFQHVHRQQVEDQIWHAWVSIREPMRQEFERKWAEARPSSRTGRAEAAAAAEKKQAWESWFMRNKDTWNAGKTWEDVSWGAYWSDWRPEQDKWGAAWGQKAENNPGAGHGSAWSQQSSQEFWDHTAGRGSGGGGGQSYDSYSSRYAGSSGSWGSSSTHADSGGYRYTYEEPAGGQSSSSNSRGKHQDPWSNSRQQSRRSYSGKSYNGAGQSGAGFTATKVDFYSVLGVDASATNADIKKAYRKAALANHPDLNPGPGSTERMQEVVIAYMTLKDSSKRQQYDRHGV